MTTSGSVSVPSAIHAHLTLNVTGGSTFNFATDFANVLNAAETAGKLLIEDLDTPLPAPGSALTTEYTVSQAGVSATIPSAGAYLLDDATGNTTVTGSGGGDTVLAAIGGMTYLDKGGDTNILFVNGNNTYLGSALPASAGSATITGGAGNDTIETGQGNATVFSGTGSAFITLNDTLSSGARDLVYLGDGHNTVDAFGASDVVDAAAFGQTIDGGMSAADRDTIVIALAQPGGSADDLINANQAAVNVSDFAGGNTINGGSGLLQLIVAAAPAASVIADTIVAGTGPSNLFGSSGTDLVLSGPASAALSQFIAGAGHEVFDASAYAGKVAVFANATGTMTFAAGSGVDTVIGGVPAAHATASATLYTGSGKLDIFAQNGDALTVNAAAGSGPVLFVGGTGNETLDGGAAAAPLTVFGGVGNLNLKSGSGGLTFIGGYAAGRSPAATINAGSGGATVFGSDGDAITILSPPSGPVSFFAGAGNETLDGAGVTGAFHATANNLADPIKGGNVDESITGGAGPNFFATGSGYETFVAGSGTNAFQIDKTLDGLGGTITIYNYTAQDIVSFKGFDAADEQSAISSEKAVTNGIVGTQITLSDQTTVLFVDIALKGITFST